jgi:hypothetical protein
VVVLEEVGSKEEGHPRSCLPPRVLEAELLATVYSIMTADTVKNDDGLVRWTSWRWMRASMAVASLCLSIDDELLPVEAADRVRRRPFLGG